MGRGEEREVGEAESDEGADWNNAGISLLSSLGGVGDAAGGEGPREDFVELPLRRASSAGTEPNDLTSSCFMGAGAGEEEMGAETSSMEPKVTAEAVREDEEMKREKRRNVPCLTAGTLLRGMLTPSFMGTPRPSALGRREWLRWG